MKSNASFGFFLSLYLQGKCDIFRNCITRHCFHHFSYKFSSMAVDDQLTIHAPLSATSTLSSSSSSTRRQLVQVATNNSSAFIQFPNTSRQLSCIPPVRPREDRSRTRPFTCEADIRLASNAPLPTILPTDRTQQQRLNPILNNSLLNHRKEQPKSSPIKISTDYSITTQLCLTSKPSKAEHQIPTIRTDTSQEAESSASDEQNENEDDDNQEETEYLDKSKYDYITRWLQEVEQAQSSAEKLFKTKRSKTKCL